jgi:hypothetical protein
MEVQMSNLVVFVNYEVKEEMREQYLDLMKEVKSSIIKNANIEYNVFECKSKKNYFSEVFKCQTRESFNTFNQLASTKGTLNFLLSEVDKCIKNYCHVQQNEFSYAA